MLISELIEQVRGDLKSLGELGGPETAVIAERLGTALEPALQKRFLDSLNQLIQEFNLQDGAPLAMNLEGDEIRLTRLLAAGVEEPSPAPSPGDYSARIALRLS